MIYIIILFIENNVRQKWLVTEEGVAEIFQ